MNLLEILGKVKDVGRMLGGEVVKDFVPGGEAIVNAVNGFLPDGLKLGDNATVNDVEAVVGKLPPEQRAQLLGKKFDVEVTQIKEQYKTNRTMLKVDAADKKSTRGEIALMQSKALCFEIISLVSVVVYSVLTGNTGMLGMLTGAWEMILALITPQVVLLTSYFGNVVKERADTKNAANGIAAGGGLIKALRGK